MFTPGQTIQVTWYLSIPHSGDDLVNTGVMMYWKDNTNPSDQFQSHALLSGLVSSDNGASAGYSSQSVVLPNASLPDATLLWLWTSVDGGYYFGCADFEIAPLVEAQPAQPAQLDAAGASSILVSQVFITNFLGLSLTNFTRELLAHLGVPSSCCPSAALSVSLAPSSVRLPINCSCFALQLNFTGPSATADAALFLAELRTRTSNFTETQLSRLLYSAAVTGEPVWAAFYPTSDPGFFSGNMIYYLAAGGGFLLVVFIVSVSCCCCSCCCEWCDCCNCSKPGDNESESAPKLTKLTNPATQEMTVLQFIPLEMPPHPVDILPPPSMAPMSGLPAQDSSDYENPLSPASPKRGPPPVHGLPSANAILYVEANLYDPSIPEPSDPDEAPPEPPMSVILPPPTETLYMGDRPVAGNTEHYEPGDSFGFQFEEAETLVSKVGDGEISM
jgi:hypothetical protein